MQRLKTNLTHPFNGRAERLIATIGLVVALGLLSLLLTHAASLVLSTQTESASLTNGVVVVADGSASGGKYIQFGVTTPALPPAPAPPITPTQTPTPVPAPSQAATRPDVTNTGVPLGLMQGGIRDSRVPQALKTPAQAGLTVGGGRFIVKTPNQVFDHIDFTDVSITIQAAASNTTFKSCKFATTSATPGPDFIMTQGAVNGLTITDSTFLGQSADIHYPVNTFLISTGGNSSGLTNFVLARNNLSGFNDAIDYGAWDGAAVTANYVHDLVVDKHADAASGYTDPSKWGHSDCTQIGHTSYVRNIMVSGNNFNCLDPSGDLNSNSVLMVGAMADGGTITNVRYDSNWCAGGQYMFNAHPPIQVVGYFEFINNKIEPIMHYGVKSGSFSSLITKWSNNTWASSGMTPTNKPVQVTAGQLVP